MGRFLFNSAYALGLLLLVVLSAEITTRVEDRSRYGAPFWSTPDFDYDLFQTNSAGIRQGKPYGRHKKWRLNQFGFRSPEVPLERTPGKKRVMILGSSETFGVYESAGKDYPALLDSLLNKESEYEVINTSLPGMTLKSASEAFETRFSKFKPDFVVVYVSPLFYLNKTTQPTSTPTKQPSVKNLPAPPMRSRLFDKLKDAIDKPDFWQRRIDAQTLAARRAALEANCVYNSLPHELLDLFVADLAALVHQIESMGATPLLVTHAVQSQTPPTPADVIALQSFLIHTPRATSPLILEFEAAAREEMLAFAAAKKLPLVDLAQALNGNHEAFGDMVHFTDTGATIAARLISTAIFKLPIPCLDAPN